MLQSRQRQLILHHLPPLQIRILLRWNILQWRRNMRARVISRTMILQRVCTFWGLKLANSIVPVHGKTRRYCCLHVTESQARGMCESLASVSGESTEQGEGEGGCMCSQKQEAAPRLLAGVATDLQMETGTCPESIRASQMHMEEIPGQSPQQLGERMQCTGII